MVYVCLQICVCREHDGCPVCFCAIAAWPSAKSPSPVPGREDPGRAGPGSQLYGRIVLEGISPSPAPSLHWRGDGALAFYLSESQLLLQFKSSFIIPAQPASQALEGLNSQCQGKFLGNCDQSWSYNRAGHLLDANWLHGWLRWLMCSWLGKQRGWQVGLPREADHKDAVTWKTVERISFVLKKGLTGSRAYPLSS